MSDDHTPKRTPDESGVQFHNHGPDDGAIGALAAMMREEGLCA